MPNYPYDDLSAPLDTTNLERLNNNYDQIQADIQSADSASQQRDTVITLDYTTKLNAQKTEYTGRLDAQYAEYISKFEQQQSEYTTRLNNQNTDYNNKLQAQKMEYTTLINAQNQKVDNVADQISEEVFQQIVEDNKTTSKTPVSNYAELLTTYPDPENGWEVQTLNDGKIYRRVLDQWVYVKELTPGPVVALEDNLETSKTYLSVTDQPNHVRDVQKLTSSKQKMNVQIAVGNLKQFFVNIQNTDTKGITYAFRKNGNDDYITLMEGSVGTITPQVAVIESRNNDTESGTFVKTNAPNYYTSTTNNWIASSFVGTKVTLNSFANNQGGLWEAVLDEGTGGEQRANISVYSATPVTIKESTLFQNLEKKKHTIKLIFKGQDPANPVASPRGWYFYGGTRPQDVARTFNVYDDTFSITQTTQAMYSYSNKEFAISARPNGTALAYQFVPEHNATGTAFNLQDTQLLVDGKPVIWNTGNYYNEVETVQLIQKVKGVHPSEPTAPLMEILTYHTIKNGVVTVSGKIKFLRDTQIDVGYAGMLPYFVSFAKKIKTSLGNTYPVITDQPNLKEFWVESDKAQSFAILNDVDAGEKMNTVVTMTLDNFSRTNRFGEVGRGTPFSWIEHRGSTLGKLYFQQFSNTVALTGEEFHFDVSYLTTLLPLSSEYLL